MNEKERIREKSVCWEDDDEIDSLERCEWKFE